jgi:UPF0716 protein FxsA
MIRLAVGLFLIVMPVLELVLLVRVGQSIGPLWTVVLVVGMAFTGILILSQQSFTAFRQALEALNQGHPPVTQVLDGLFLMTAGALLLMPGFITDAMALVLLVPPLRRAIGRWSVARILQHAPADIDGSEWEMRQQPEDRAGARRPGREAPVIEGEFERLDESPASPTRGNGVVPR